MDKFFASWVATIFPFSLTKISEKVFTKNLLKISTTRIIIDGTKIFVERATSLKTKARTWSNYKHVNTWKALVGISSNGIVSSLWTGRVSDKKLTCSGLLGKLEPGDNMADKGLDVTDIFPSGVTLNIPRFKGAWHELKPEETYETARIAAVKINVERTMSQIKNYHI